MIKKMLMAIVFSCACAITSLSARDLTGTYDLVGTNSRTGVATYRGQVIIEPFGYNYRVIWMVGSNQIQGGIGVLNQDETVLSVAYSDTSRGEVGVVSYDILSSIELEGKWASMNAQSYGRENLIWISPHTN